MTLTEEKATGVNIGLSRTQREGAVALLQSLLADEYTLYTKTRNFHWNVTGPRFHDAHKFFESQYEELDGIIDEVAERVRALGGVALGSHAEFAAHARLKETPGAEKDASALTAALLADHEQLIQHLRADLETAQNQYGDAGTADFLTGLLSTHEKMAWMLRAHLG